MMIGAVANRRSFVSDLLCEEILALLVYQIKAQTRGISTAALQASSELNLLV